MPQTKLNAEMEGNNFMFKYGAFCMGIDVIVLCKGVLRKL